MNTRQHKPSHDAPDPADSATLRALDDLAIADRAAAPASLEDRVYLASASRIISPSRLTTMPAHRRLNIMLRSAPLAIAASLALVVTLAGVILTRKGPSGPPHQASSATSSLDLVRFEQGFDALDDFDSLLNDAFPSTDTGSELVLLGVSEDLDRQAREGLGDLAWLFPEGSL